MGEVFIDRTDAGRRLAQRLLPLREQDPVILGVPRGGVPVAFVVAQALEAPLDVIVVRKLGVPYQPELAMGAVGEGDVLVLDQDVVRRAGVTDDEVATALDRERGEVLARARRFRGDHTPVPITGRTVLVVDDGVATGSTMRAACQVARAHGARRVVVAVPVGASDTVRILEADADEVICLSTPRHFFAVGQWYDDFSPTSDREVTRLLERAAEDARRSARATDDPGPDPSPLDEDITLRLEAASLSGHVTVPDRACGIVVFAHGSGSSRHSPRNRFVAHRLNQAALATLLFDLLTPDEETSRRNVFDIELLADRLAQVRVWLAGQARLAHLPVGYFGASTGAAAALVASTRVGSDVAAVVSRGGRPDLAGDRLALVRAPTLLIVGGRDTTVLQLNKQARAQLRCPNRLVVVPGATHLFEEPGTLETAAQLARDWFVAHFTTVRAHQPG